MNYRACVCLLAVAFCSPISGYYTQPEIIQFSEHPQSQVLAVNSTLTLNCSLSTKSLDRSLPLPEIKWRFDGHNVTSCVSNTTDQGLVIMSVCIITSVTVDKSGWYSCNAVDGEKDCSPPCYPSVTSSASAYVLVLDKSEDTSVTKVDSNCSSMLLTSYEVPGFVVANLEYRDDLFWKKNGKSIANTSEVQVLPSGSLLLSSHHMTNLLGTYHCIGGSGITIRTHVLELDVSLKTEASLQLLVSYPTYSSATSYHLMPGSPIELVCLQNKICATSNVTWSRNGLELMSMQGQYWMRYDSVIPGNYCCSMEGGLETFTSCVSVSEKDLPAGTSVNSTILMRKDSYEAELNCPSSTDSSIYWKHNGNRLLADSPVLNISVSEPAAGIYGVYQCFMENSSVGALSIDRILPYGLTNPPTSVSVAVYPPSDTYDYGTHTITCNPPLFTGGLNTTDIHYKVLLSSSTEEYELPGCLQQVYETCDMSCLLVVFLDEGYREFQVIAVDADGHAISQSSEVIRISGLECDVYVPATPIISFTCEAVDSTLFWKKADIAFFPGEEFTNTGLVCFSGSEIIKEHKVSEPGSVISSSIQVSQTLAIGDVCEYSAYGSSYDCIGSTTSGVCTVTTKTTSSLGAGLSTPVASTPPQSISSIVDNNTTGNSHPLTSSLYLSTLFSTGPSISSFSFSVSLSSHSIVSSADRSASNYISSPSSLPLHSRTTTTTTSSNQSVVASIVPSVSSVSSGLTSNEILVLSVTVTVCVCVVFVILLLTCMMSLAHRKPSHIADVLPMDTADTKFDIRFTDDCESIVTDVVSPEIVDFDIPISNAREFLFVPKWNSSATQGTEGEQATEETEKHSGNFIETRNIQPSSANGMLQSWSHPPVPSYDYDRKTSTNISSSDSSGTSLDSDPSQDYVGLDAYMKQNGVFPRITEQAKLEDIEEVEEKKTSGLLDASSTSGEHQVHCKRKLYHDSSLDSSSEDINVHCYENMTEQFDNGNPSSDFYSSVKRRVKEDDIDDSSANTHTRL